MANRFRAFRIERSAQGEQKIQLQDMPTEALVAGQVRIAVEYSSVNYKDALAITGQGPVLRRWPLTAGIDLAGTIIESTVPRLPLGLPVVATGYDIGVAHDGGYAEQAVLPAEWLQPLPAGLDTRQAMLFGTAGLTAALMVRRLLDCGQRSSQGPILVSGASGGVGSVAIALLATQGFSITALTGKPEQADYLRTLGATECMARDVLMMGEKPLEKALWGGALDTVGGAVLSWLTRTVRPGGNIAACGMAAGIALTTTVLPFILRGISLLGIDSVQASAAQRAQGWHLLADAIAAPTRDSLLAEEIALADLPAACERLLASKVRGRILVNLSR